MREYCKWVREGREGRKGAEWTRVDGRGRGLVFALIEGKRVRGVAVEFQAVMSVWAIADFGEVHVPSVFSFIITSPYNLPIKHHALIQQSSYNPQDVKTNPS